MSRRNPNGYGCVTKLKGNRSRPWCVKVTVYDEEGNARQKPVGYAETEEQANILLARYNNNPWNIDREKVTLAILYQRWCEIRLPKLGDANQSKLRSAYKYLSKYYGIKYRGIKAYQMQESIDNCGRGYATQGSIKSLWGHLDRFAFELDIIDKMYSQLITCEQTPETQREPFTSDQIEALWKIKDEPFVDTVLVYIYTGFRLNELLGMKTEQVNTKEWYFQNGSKSAAGKGRIIPVHEKIRPFVQSWIDKGTTYLVTYKGKKVNRMTYYRYWEQIMQKIDVDKTPHEARHTFETMLDNAKANKKCIDMLMGHKSRDVGNRIYNHKTIQQLRETIALLK